MVREGVKNPHPNPPFQKEPPILGNLPISEKSRHPPHSHTSSFKFIENFSRNLKFYSSVKFSLYISTLIRTLPQFNNHLVNVMPQFVIIALICNSLPPV